MKSKTMIAIVAITAVISAMLMLSSCSHESGPSADPNALHNRHNDENVEPEVVDFSNGKHHVLMTVDGYEPVEIELDADAAPITVENFCNLVVKGFYDGLSFYRFQEGFCIQGGSSNYSAAPDLNDTNKTIKGEFSANGVNNPLADDFKRGTVAMARSQDPDSAATTFFITMDSSSMVSMSLNGQYAAFGIINEDGMKVMDKIMSDFVNKVDDQSMGMISEKENQAIIKSFEIIN